MAVAVAIGVEIDFGDLLTHGVAHFGDAVADGGGAFKFEGFGGGIHFGLELGDVFLGDVLGFVRAADRGIGTGVGRGFGFDAVANRFLNCGGRDAVLAIVFFLHRAAAVGLVDGLLHRVGHNIGVENDGGVNVACSAADRLQK